MQPLLSIQTVSIAIESKSTKASLEMQRPAPSVNVTRQKGRSEIRTNPAKLKTDTFEAKAAMGLKSPRRSIDEFSSAGKTAAYEYTRMFADYGHRIADTHGKGDPIVDFARSRTISDFQTALVFTPSVGPEFSVEGGGISFDFTMDRLVFDWNLQHRPQVDYVPGEISYQVTQYPEVIIEYLGDPIYVPPSADPNYNPPLLDAIA